MNRQPEEASNPATSAERLIELSEHAELRSTVASNYAAPASLLERLAGDQDEAVRQAVARNPNTPWKTLQGLAIEFSQEFLHNPAARLQMVAHPEQISLDSKLWDALVQNAELPPLWWSWLKSRPAAEVSQAVRLHVQYAGEAVHPFGVLEQEEGWDQLALVELLSIAHAQGATLPVLVHTGPGSGTEMGGEQIIIDRLRCLARNKDFWVRAAAARNEYTPTEVLRGLAQDEEGYVRTDIAVNPQTPVEVLSTLTQDEDFWVRLALVGNRQTPIETLSALAQDEDWQVREKAAWTARMPVEALYRLVRDEDEEDEGPAVRLALIVNPQVPIDLLWHLAQNKDATICAEARKAIVQHKQVPAEMLLDLAQAEEAEIRQTIAQNERTPTQALQILAREQDETIRQAVASNPQTPVDVLLSLAQDQAWKVRQAVARNRQTPVTTLLDLAQDASDSVRAAVACNKQTPLETVLYLAQDASSSVREGAACNKQTPVDVLRTLSQDEEWYVRRSVANNEQTPIEVLHMLTRDEEYDVRQAMADNKQMPVEVLHMLAQDEEEGVRWTVACNEQTPAEILRMLAWDKKTSVRKEVASNKQTPLDVLHVLAQDEEVGVRWQADLLQNLLIEASLYGQKVWGTIGRLWWKLDPYDEIDSVEDASLKRLLDQIIELDASEHLRQAIIAALVTAWDSTRIQAAFQISETVFDANHHFSIGQESARRIMTPFLPPIALQKLAASPTWEVRYLVACHDQTSRDTRQHLSQDSNRYVRAMARAKEEMSKEKPAGVGG